MQNIVFKAFINRILLCLIMSFIVFSCSSRTNGATYKQTMVSYYADKFEGKKTASGQTYRHSGMTASNTSLPFGTRVEILNEENGKSVTVTVNDRGPLKASREFDLSQGAFKRIASLNQGIIKVKYRILK